MSPGPSRQTCLVVPSLTHPTGKQAGEQHARGSHETESEGLCRQVRAGEMAGCRIETLRPDWATDLSRNGQEDVRGLSLQDKGQEHQCTTSPKGGLSSSARQA